MDFQMASICVCGCSCFCLIPKFCREVTSLCSKFYTNSDSHRELWQRSLLLRVRVKSKKKRKTHIVESELLT